MRKARVDILGQQKFSLCLSSGYFGFFAHAGFAKAFEDLHLKPSLVTGSSAGAIVAAAVASEIPSHEMEKIFLGLKKSDFWDPSIGLGLIKGEKIEKLLSSYLPANFKDLSIPLQISVFDILARKTVSLATGESVAKACRASAAVPFLFHPVRIGKRYYWDGGILDKPAVLGVPIDQTVVYHYLESTDVISQYESKKLYSHRYDSPFFLSIPKIPSAGPNKLHFGEEILNYCYQETKKWLLESISSSLQK